MARPRAIVAALWRMASGRGVALMGRELTRAPAARPPDPIYTDMPARRLGPFGTEALHPEDVQPQGQHARDEHGAAAEARATDGLGVRPGHAEGRASVDEGADEHEGELERGRRRGVAPQAEAEHRQVADRP